MPDSSELTQLDAYHGIVSRVAIDSPGYVHDGAESDWLLVERNLGIAQTADLEPRWIRDALSALGQHEHIVEQNSDEQALAFGLKIQ